jgi:hypothetical protein
LKHFASPDFWRLFNQLPTHIQQLARSNFELLKTNPRHPSLHFKKAGRYWSVRVGLAYRALGIDVEGGILWSWIGSHAEYDKLISS